MKSFYTVDELTDVSLTITFTLPTFLGLGPSAMTSAILSVTCMHPNGTNLGVVENTITTITAGASVEVTLAGSLFVGTDDTSGNEFSMIQDGGKFIIKIYNNNSGTEDNLLVRKEVPIDLENLAVATDAGTLTVFEAVNIDPEAISGGSTSTVKMKVPCDKIFTMTNKAFQNPVKDPFNVCGYGKNWSYGEGEPLPGTGPVGSNIVFIETRTTGIYKLGFMKNTNTAGNRAYVALEPDIPDEAPVTELNTSHCFTNILGGLGNDITGMFFRLDPASNDYIMRLDSSNVGPLSMDDPVLRYRWLNDNPGTESKPRQGVVEVAVGLYEKKILRDVINDDQFNTIVWTITPIC